VPEIKAPANYVSDGEWSDIEDGDTDNVQIANKQSTNLTSQLTAELTAQLDEERKKRQDLEQLLICTTDKLTAATAELAAEKAAHEKSTAEMKLQLASLTTDCKKVLQDMKGRYDQLSKVREQEWQENNRTIDKLNSQLDAALARNTFCTNTLLMCDLYDLYYPKYRLRYLEESEE